jgi:hypothetical protein
VRAPEACLDFFHISGRSDLAHRGRISALQIRPAVRSPANRASIGSKSEQSIAAGAAPPGHCGAISAGGPGASSYERVVAAPKSARADGTFARRKRLAQFLSEAQALREPNQKTLDLDKGLLASVIERVKRNPRPCLMRFRRNMRRQVEGQAFAGVLRGPRGLNWMRAAEAADIGHAVEDARDAVRRGEGPTALNRRIESIRAEIRSKEASGGAKSWEMSSQMRGMTAS